MKLRNLANKFLLVAVLVIFALANCATYYYVPSTLTTTTAEELTALTKTYYFNERNVNRPTDQSLYEALGITVYNDYLTALSATQRLNEVVIAVVDTGLDPTHPVFNDRILTEYAMDFSYGLPTVENQWNLDENGHGTHVAGIIADITLANVKILPIKIFHGVSNSGSGAAFDNALRYLAALKKGVSLPLLQQGGFDFQGNPGFVVSSTVRCNTARKKINNLVAVNLSVGTRGYALNDQSALANYEEQKTIYQQKLDSYLWGNQILPIAAAGNRGSEDYTMVRNQNGELVYAPYYSLPGACDRILTVSAYDNTDNEYSLASYSYYNDHIGLAAPGTKIWSVCSSSIVEKLPHATPIDDKVDYNYQYKDATGTGQWYVEDVDDVYYLRSNGTSMATPFVTACYALLMSDSSKTKITDYGLVSWKPKTEDKNFLNPAHKAMLAAAATNGANLESGYSMSFGYGTVDVSSFVPNDETGTIDELAIIEPPIQTTAYDGSLLTDENSVDWFYVCVVLLIAVIGIWVFNRFRAYMQSFVKKGETEDDHQQQ